MSIFRISHNCIPTKKRRCLRFPCVESTACGLCWISVGRWLYCWRSKQCRIHTGKTSYAVKPRKRVYFSIIFWPLLETTITQTYTGPQGIHSIIFSWDIVKQLFSLCCTQLRLNQWNIQHFELSRVRKALEIMFPPNAVAQEPASIITETVLSRTQNILEIFSVFVPPSYVKLNRTYRKHFEKPCAYLIPIIARGI